MLAPGGYRSLGQNMWAELGATINGILEDQEVKPNNKLNFIGWCRAYHPRYQWYEFNTRIARLLQLVADGEMKRLMLFIPPRHGKSELVSRLFTAYYLYRHADRWVGVCSYGATLAETLSRAARTNFLAGGGQVRHDSRAVTHWETTAGGGMWAAGVGGGILGKGCHLGVIDDPTKDAVEALSPTVQRTQQEWWQSTFRSRWEPGAAVVIVMQRWFELDLPGWLMKQEMERTRPEAWHIVAWEALKEEEKPVELDPQDPDSLINLQMASGVDPTKVQQVANYIWPNTVTLEPDWRQAGEAICPERYDRDDLLDIKDGTSAFFWSAMYQQRPRPKEGMLFKLEHFTIVAPHEVPASLVDVRGWDYAATEDAGDFTCGTRLFIGMDGYLYIRHVARGQWATGKRDEVIRQTMEMDGPFVYQGREQEPGSAGKDVVIHFHEDHPGARTFTRRATGSKFLRVDPLVAEAQNRGIRLVQGPWNQMYIDELVAFGSGTAHDDCADSTALAYEEAKARAFVIQAQQNRHGTVSMRILK